LGGAGCPYKFIEGPPGDVCPRSPLAHHLRFGSHSGVTKVAYLSREAGRTRCAEDATLGHIVSPGPGLLAGFALAAQRSAPPSVRVVAPADTIQIVSNVYVVLPGPIGNECGRALPPPDASVLSWGCACDAPIDVKQLRVCAVWPCPCAADSMCQKVLECPFLLLASFLARGVHVSLSTNLARASTSSGGKCCRRRRAYGRTRWPGSGCKHGGLYTFPVSRYR
jgi:hypothetical protein